MSRPTYRRHPMDKRRPAPHLAPRSRKRLRHEQRFENFLRRWLDGLAAAADTSRVSQDDFALAPPPADTIHSRAAAAALGPDPRQENHS